MMNWLVSSWRSTITPTSNQEEEEPNQQSMIRSTSTNSRRDLADTRGLVDLVDLIPFDVQIVLTDNQGIQMFEVTDIVTSWMNRSFQRQLADLGYEDDKRYAEFDSVILLDRDAARRRKLADDASWLGLEETAAAATVQEEHLPRLLQAADTSKQQPAVLYTARFEGVALFTRDETRPFQVPTGDVLEMQRNAIHSHDDDLWMALADSDASGLGSQVAAVNAYLNPIRSFGSNNDNNNAKDEQLQLVIVVAVCVACVAFLFLIMAMVWAWRYDRQNRAAYLVQNNNEKRNNTADDGQPDPTGSTTTFDESPDKTLGGSPSSNNNNKRPPFEVYGGDLYGSRSGGRGGGDVDEDISTALSQYYRSGLGSSSVAFHKSSQLGDNVSVSSMESYGYSLDGYAPTISTPMPSDIPRAREAVGGLTADGDDDDEEEEEEEHVVVDVESRQEEQPSDEALPPAQDEENNDKKDDDKA